MPAAATARNIALAFLKLTLVAFGLLYAVALSGIYAFQRDLQYFPTHRDPAPETLGLTGVDLKDESDLALIGEADPAARLEVPSGPP